jgi:hypothetical protein
VRDTKLLNASSDVGRIAGVAEVRELLEKGWLD